MYATSTAKSNFVKIGSSAGTDLSKSKSFIEVSISSGSITSITVYGATNKDDEVGTEAFVCWDGTAAISTTNHIGYGGWTCPHRKGESSTPNSGAITMPSGTKIVRIFRGVTIKDDKNDDVVLGASTTPCITSIKVSYASTCAATAPGNISKGELTSGSITLTAAGSAASGDTWYWQDAADGTATNKGTGATKSVNVAGTYYIRSYNTAGECWSAAKSVTVVAADFLATPTVTFNDGNYEVGAAALNLGGLFESQNTSDVSFALKVASEDATISGSSFTATKAGSYVVVATQAADANYKAVEKEATITVTVNPLGTHTITYTLSPINTSDASLTSTQVSTSTYLKNLTTINASLCGFASSPSAGKNRTAKINRASSEKDNDKYVYLSFDVESGYQFTPTSIVVKVANVSNATTFDASLISSDGPSVGEDAKSFSSTDGTVETWTITNEAGTALTGTVTLKIWPYAASAGSFRFGTPITITGTVAAKPTPTAPSISAPTADSEAEYDLGSTITALEVTATGYPAPAYQWYKNDTKTTEGATAIDGAESANYTPANDAASDFYYYCVATNASGSATSHFFHVTVNSCTPPTAPASLGVDDGTLTYNSATLSWDGKSAGAHGYVIALTSEAEGATGTFDWKDESTAMYVATGLKQGTEYTFKVKYKGGAGECEYSEEVTKTFTTTVPTVADLVTIDADYTFTPSAALTTNTLYEEGKIISLGGSSYNNGIQIKTNRQIAFKVSANAKIKVTFNTKDTRELQIGTTSAGTDLAHSPESPISAVRAEAGIVYLSASSDLYMTKLEIFYPKTVTYALNGGDGTLPTESAHYVGDKFNLHNGEDGITAPTDKEFAGWNDGTTTYVGGAEYTMGASAVMLTAQWATPLPAPTITFNDGNYTIAGAALDLSTLFSSNSDGAVTYTVKTAGETGAAIDGTNFTATAAGLAVITATQAATASYKTKSVDATITISAPAEVDGVKLVVDGDLTGNYRTACTLTSLSGSNKYTIAGLNYTKYIKFGSSVSSWSAVAGPSNKYLAYTPTKKTTNFYFYVHNNSSSASYINLYLIEEGNVTPSKVQVEVAGNANVLKTYELNITKNTEVYITAESNNVYYCQVVAVESGDALPQAPAVGYEMNLNKGRLSTTSATATTLDGLTFVLSSGYSIASSTVATIGTKGTHYVSFTIPEGQTRQLQLTTSNTNKYTVSKTKGDDANQFTPTANEAKNWNLTPGTWYINPQGSNVQITNIAFAAAPTSYTVTFDADGGSSVDDQIVFEGGKATEPAAPTKSSYDFIGWYNGADLYDFDEVVSADLTLTAHWTVHVTNDATLKSLKYGEQSIALADGVYEYNVELPYYTAGVPALTAVTNSKDAKTPVITNAADFDVNNQATSTVSVTSEDETVTLVYQVHFTKLVLYEWLEISGSINWDFTKAATAQIKLDETTTVKKDEEAVMANIPGSTNNATFNSQALKFKGEYIHRTDDGTKYPSCASTIKFKTTVPGIVTVRYADNGGNNRCLSINGHLGAASSSKTDYKTYSVCVPAGEVVLTGVQGTTVDKYMRFFEIDFKAASELNPANADESTLGGYERNVTEGRYGTICLPNGGVMVGASVFEIAYMDYKDNKPFKIYFDEIANGTMIAGRPYIFLPNESVTRLGVFYTDAAGADAGNYRGLYGSYSEINLTANDGNYILLNNMYYYVNSDNVYCSPNRAYIKLADVPDYDPGKPAYGRRRVALDVHSEQVATGIGNTELSEQPMKVMINGQLYILRGEQMFDATGRLVK